MKVAITVRKRVMIFAVMFVARCIYPCKMDGIIVRRVIPSDNSCLFNAVGCVMDHDKNKAPELRQVIAATVASDPVKYSEVFLGKPNEEHSSWIQDSEKWGVKSIAQVNEDALKQMEVAHENFKTEVEKLKKSLEAEVVSLRVRVS